MSEKCEACESINSGWAGKERQRQILEYPLEEAVTLAEIAAKLQSPYYPDGRATSDYGAGVLSTIRAFEADPDFTLRARIEALATEFLAEEAPDGHGGWCIDAPYVHRRLRECLERK